MKFTGKKFASQFSMANKFIFNIKACAPRKPKVLV